MECSASIVDNGRKLYTLSVVNLEGCDNFNETKNIPYKNVTGSPCFVVRQYIDVTSSCIQGASLRGKNVTALNENGEMYENKRTNIGVLRKKLAFFLVKFAQLPIVGFISRNISRNIFNSIAQNIAQNIAAEAQCVAGTSTELSHANSIKFLRKLASLHQLHGEALLISGDKQSAINSFYRAQLAYDAMTKLTIEPKIIASARENAHGLLVKICDITDDASSLYNTIKQMVNIRTDLEKSRQGNKIAYGLKNTENKYLAKLVKLLPKMETISEVPQAIEISNWITDRLKSSLSRTHAKNPQKKDIAIKKMMLSVYANLAAAYATQLKLNPSIDFYIHDNCNTVAGELIRIGYETETIVSQMLNSSNVNDADKKEAISNFIFAKQTSVGALERHVKTLCDETLTFHYHDIYVKNALEMLIALCKISAKINNLPEITELREELSSKKIRYREELNAINQKLSQLPQDTTDNDDSICSYD
jgi:hypothetical protein